MGRCKGNERRLSLILAQGGGKSRELMLVKGGEEAGSEGIWGTEAFDLEVVVTKRWGSNLKKRKNRMPSSA